MARCIKCRYALKIKAGEAYIKLDDGRLLLYCSGRGIIIPEDHNDCELYTPRS